MIESFSEGEKQISKVDRGRKAGGRGREREIRCKDSTGERRKIGVCVGGATSRMCPRPGMWEASEGLWS